MRTSGRIWKVLALCVLMVFMLGCSVVTSLLGPTPTPTPIPPTATPTPIPATATPTQTPVHILKGRLLYKDDNTAVADTSLTISNEKGVISFGAGGILENPEGKTDADGRFAIEVDEDYLKKNNYQVIVFAWLKDPGSISSEMYPLRHEDGILTIIELPTNPITVDLGDVYVIR